jgi:hypothetical protein
LHDPHVFEGIGGRDGRRIDVLLGVGGRAEEKAREDEDSEATARKTDHTNGGKTGKQLETRST